MAYRIEMLHHKTGENVEALEKLNVEAYKGIQKAYDCKCEIEARHCEKLREACESHNVVNDIMVSPILRRMAEMYNKKHYSEKKKGKQENQRCKHVLYQSKPDGTTVLGRSLKKNNATPLLAVRRTEKGPIGQQKGSITTNLDDIDEIVRKQYGRI